MHTAQTAIKSFTILKSEVRLAMTDNFVFLLAEYTDMKTEEERAAYLETLEQFVRDCQSAARQGREIVPDAVYDTAVEKLRVLVPDSPLINHVWSEDVAPLDANLDKYLAKNSMMSIRTIKSLDGKDFGDFCKRLADVKAKIGSVTLHASMKENGHGIRWVYQKGHLVKAHTRGRSSNGRDITDKIKLILDEYKPELAQYELLEFRGEVLLPLENVEDLRDYKDIKSAFSGVSTCLADSAPAELTKLLEIAAYAVYSDELQLNTLSDMYNQLSAWGFTVPEWNTFTLSDNLQSQVINDILPYFDNIFKTYRYYTDGVVLSVDSLSLLNQLGNEGSTKLGNVALKVGTWQQNIYYATIEEIIWKEGRTKLTPVARITPTITSTGNTVQNVPLYAPIYILQLEAYPGNTIYFRYGGEAGVVPCTSTGLAITDPGAN